MGFSGPCGDVPVDGPDVIPPVFIFPYIRKVNAPPAFEEGLMHAGPVSLGIITGDDSDFPDGIQTFPG